MFQDVFLIPVPTLCSVMRGLGIFAKVMLLPFRCPCDSLGRGISGLSHSVAGIAGVTGETGERSDKSGYSSLHPTDFVEELVGKIGAVKAEAAELVKFDKAELQTVLLLVVLVESTGLTSSSSGITLSRLVLLCLKLIR